MKGGKPSNFELSKTARMGARNLGVGAVVLASHRSSAPVQFYTRESIVLLLADKPRLYGEVSEAMQRYDPESEFVLLELAKEEALSTVSIQPMALGV